MEFHFLVIRSLVIAFLQVQPVAAALLACLDQAKHPGAKTKYSSRSQHSRLAEAGHLARIVVAAARFVCAS